MRIIPYGRQNISLGDAILSARVAKARYITQGPRIEEFEAKFCEITAAKFAVAVSSGTAALHLAALVSEVSSAKEVVVPSLTFAASASAVMLAGGKPSLVDISPSTWNLDTSQVRPNVDVIVAVDFAGLPSQISESNSVGAEKVIADCAHSLGARTPSGPVGSSESTLMSCFSLHPVKAITSGEGGVVTTNDYDTAMRLRELRSHGINRRDSVHGWDYEIESIGLNYRLTEIQAAIATSQLGRLGRFIESRNEIAERYRTLLCDFPVTLPPAAPDGYLHAYHLFPILLRGEEERDFVYKFLHSKGVLVQVHYKPLHTLKAFKNLDRHNGQLTSSEDAGSRILSLPIFPGLRKRDQQRVVRELGRAIRIHASGGEE